MTDSNVVVVGDETFPCSIESLDVHQICASDTPAIYRDETLVVTLQTDNKLKAHATDWFEAKLQEDGEYWEVVEYKTDGTTVRIEFGRSRSVEMKTPKPSRLAEIAEKYSKETLLQAWMTSALIMMMLIDLNKINDQDLGMIDITALRDGFLQQKFLDTVDFRIEHLSKMLGNTKT